MANLDAARFPRLAAYLSFLPQGLGSHPDCQAKGAVVRAVLECHSLDDVPEGALPPEIRSMINTPPLNSQWVPDTVFFGALHAQADYHCMSETHYAEWLREANRRLFKSPVYRMIFSFTSPGMLLTLCSSTWGTMHRGTSLRILASDKTSATAQLTFPERLYDHLSVKAIAAGVLVALEQANIRSPSVSTTEITSTSARLEARWE